MGTIATVLRLLLAIHFPVGAALATTATEGHVVMGTVLEVHVDASCARTARELALEAIAIAQHWDDVLSTFRPDAELAELLRRRGIRAHISRDLQYALVRMQALTGATQGAFDPAFASALPDSPAATGALPKFFRTVEFGSRWAWVHPHGRIDPGAIGKGIAIDAILAALPERGAREVFVNFGGSSFAYFHAHPRRNRGRRVLIPGLSGEPMGTVDLRHGSLSTSLSGTRDGTQPIYDPKSGVAVAAPRVAAAWAPDAASADAWSTALVVLGRSGLAQAQVHGVEAMVADAQGVTCTTAFPWARLWPEREPC